MSGEGSSEQDLKRVRDAAILLSEHFDCVQVFCSRHEAGSLDGTVTVCYGAGNWFARYGQVQSWLTVQDEHHRLTAQKQAKEDGE